MEVPEFILGQLSSRCLLDIQMEMMNKKLDVRLEFRGDIRAGNKNDQFKAGNFSFETRCNHTGRMYIDRAEERSKSYALSYSNTKKMSGR